MDRLENWVKKTDAKSLAIDRLKVSLPQMADFCQRWQITELALFGSVLRDDFRADSDQLLRF